MVPSDLTSARQRQGACSGGFNNAACSPPPTAAKPQARFDVSAHCFLTIACDRRAGIAHAYTTVK